MSICLVDTSIFLEVLQVPGRCSQYRSVKADLESKIKAGEKLFLPLATIIETGNHIAHCGDGRQRRACAERFVSQVRMAYAGDSPFNPVSFEIYEAMNVWLGEFPECAMRGMGLADLSIVADFKRMCKLNVTRSVYVWSQDEHLSSYRRGGL